MAENTAAETTSVRGNRRSRRSLFSLYLATFIMRAAAFMTIAVITSDKYKADVDLVTIGVLVAFYPIAELFTVMYFGVLCDRIGRKPILLFAHGITAVSTLLFALTTQLYLLFAFAALYGTGLAAKTSSTLTMIADSASPKNRAQLMAFFDIVTFLGLAGGYLLGFFLLVYGFSPVLMFYLQTIAIAISVVLVWLFVDETRGPAVKKVNGWDALRSVMGRKDIRNLLPVYIPVISIYGMVISFLEKIVERQGIIGDPGLKTVLIVLGLSLVCSMIGNAWLSDRVKKRKPFMLVGLFFFGVLAVVLVTYLDNLSYLVSIWPVVVLISVGAGAFPPAVLAYLADITQQETSGTAFGVYSLVLGFGFAFGPIIGGIVLQSYAIGGFLVLIVAFLVVASLGVMRLVEPSSMRVGHER